MRWLWIKYGDNALLDNRSSAAILRFRETTSRFPRFAFAYFSLARVYVKTADLPDAESAIRTALDLGHSENAWYWVTAGDVYARSQNLVPARTAYATALTMDPTNQVARSRLSALSSIP